MSDRHWEQLLPGTSLQQQTGLVPGNPRKTHVCALVVACSDFENVFRGQ